MTWTVITLTPLTVGEVIQQDGDAYWLNTNVLIPLTVGEVIQL